MSSKSVAELTQCFNEHWQSGTARVRSAPRPGGYTLTLIFNFNSMEWVVAVIDISDQGNQRRVVAHVREPEARGPTGSELRNCL